MPKSRIQKFVKQRQLGEVSEYSLTTPGQSQYLRSMSLSNTKRTVARDPRSSRAVQDTAKLQAKINEMRARST
jgi:hypothetical protein